MNIFEQIFCYVLAFLLMLGPHNYAVNTNGEPDDINNQQRVETISPILPQSTPVTAVSKKADREYFRSVTKSTTYEEILRDLGPADWITGSGILTYHWKLDDGSVANVTFNYESRVMTLIIVKDREASEELIR